MSDGIMWWKREHILGLTLSPLSSSARSESTKVSLPASVLGVDGNQKFDIIREKWSVRASRCPMSTPNSWGWQEVVNKGIAIMKFHLQLFSHDHLLSFSILFTFIFFLWFNFYYLYASWAYQITILASHDIRLIVLKVNMALSLKGFLKKKTFNIMDPLSYVKHLSL